MSTSSGTPESWISSFCSCLGHEYFAEVTEDFIEDDFNLTGLQTQVPMYKEALEMILDVDPEEDDEDEEDEEEDDEDDEDEDDDAIMHDENGEKIDNPYRRSQSERKSLRMQSSIQVIESSAELLYGLIHQRYITSRPGIQQMADKYELQHFGCCPRVFCNSARVLPVGCNDTPGTETVKLFCPSCLDVYTPPNSRFQSVDGAFFGTTFGCLFFMTFPEFDISSKNDPLNLASTHPAFATGASLQNTTHNNNNNATQATAPQTIDTTTTLNNNNSNSNNPNKHSRSSSLTSTHNNNTPQPPPSQFPHPASALEPDLPLAPQPNTLNGVTTSNIAPGLGAGKIHEPKIYGFRVAERSKTGPRMKWLRSRPRDMNELDEVGRAGVTEEEEEMLHQQQLQQQQQQQQQQEGMEGGEEEEEEEEEIDEDAMAEEGQDVNGVGVGVSHLDSTTAPGNAVAGRKKLTPARSRRRGLGNSSAAAGAAVTAVPGSEGVGIAGYGVNGVGG